MCDYAVLVDQRREGVPRRAAAREDGDRRGVRRRGARRRGDALTHLRSGRLLRRRRARLHPHRARDRRAISTGASSGPRRRSPVDEPLLRSRRAARHRVGRPARAVRPARGASRASSTARASTSTSRTYGTSLGHRLGVDPRLSRRDPRQRAGRAVHGRRAKKATEFILLANQIDTPLVFLQNTTGYMVGKDYEQAGMIKDGAKMINAVTNSTVPHLTVMMGASYGAGNYGMCGRAYDPRFLFTWPNSKMAVMGPQQLAGVMSIVARESAASHRPRVRRGGRRRAAAGDRGADRARVARVLQQRQGLRRRRHRSARHPHRARHRAVGRPLERRRGPPRLRRVPDVDRTCAMPIEAARRQPRRDRLPRHAHRARAWASRTVAVFSDRRRATLPFVREADEAVHLPGSARRRHLPARST